MTRTEEIAQRMARAIRQYPNRTAVAPEIAYVLIRDLLDDYGHLDEAGQLGEIRAIVDAVHLAEQRSQS